MVATDSNKTTAFERTAAEVIGVLKTFYWRQLLPKTPLLQNSLARMEVYGAMHHHILIILTNNIL